MLLATTNLTCLRREDPPPLPGSALECSELPVEAFLSNAAWNFLGVELSALPPGASVDEALTRALGLGEIAPQVIALDDDLRSGSLDASRWPSLAGLPVGDAERTLVAAAITLATDLELRCEYLRYLPDGSPRTVLEVALLVNASQGHPVPDIDLVGQRFAKKGLSWEIACAVQEALGQPSCGSGTSLPLEIGPQTIIESPVLQLYAAFRGAHRAQWPPQESKDLVLIDPGPTDLFIARRPASTRSRSCSEPPPRQSASSETPAVSWRPAGPRVAPRSRFPLVP
ncbi:MAG: hypothetical protein P1V51_01680 [Deltaproteobacteria bacterium]|nr:hypothetical protein [Deltaproteobacteria bacterium]